MPIGTFPSGWNIMTATAVNPAVGVLYPNPQEKGTVPTNTYWATATATDSPFDPGTRNAVIRSIVIHRDHASTAPVVTIYNHAGTHIVATFAVNSFRGIELTDLNWFVEGGFRVAHTGWPYFTIAYEVN